MRTQLVPQFHQIDWPVLLMDLHRIASAQSDVGPSLTGQVDKVAHSAGATGRTGDFRMNLCAFIPPQIKREERPPQPSLVPDQDFQSLLAAIEAPRLTAEFRMPTVSQVSTIPFGGSGKMQVRQAVFPGRIFKVAA